MLNMTIDGTERIAANLRKWPDHRSEYVGRNLQVLGNKVGEVMRGYMHPRYYTGEGEKSLTVETSAGQGEDYVSIGPEAEHWVYVRFGTRLHWPPVEPIARWCAAKLGTDDPGVVFLVRRKIATEGTEPDPFLENTLEDSRTQDAIAETADAIGVELVAVIEGEK